MSRLAVSGLPENHGSGVGLPAARKTAPVWCISRQPPRRNRGNKKPATFELGLRQRLGRYAGNNNTQQLGFVNSHFVSIFHSTKGTVPSLDRECHQRNHRDGDLL